MKYYPMSGRPKPRHVKVDRLSKRVSQTDYLEMLGEVMQSLKVSESKPVLRELTRELGIRTKKEVRE
jgi:hypothetical protein